MTAKVSSWPYGKPFPPHDIEAKFAAAKARISELEEDLWAARTLNAPHLSTQFRNVTTVPTDEDVYVGAKCVGRILDCGDCYRVTPKDKRRKRFYREDYDTRDLAIAALTAPYRLRAGRRPRPPRAAQGRWMMVVCSEPMTSTTVFRSCRLEYGHNGPHRTQEDVWFTERAEHLATIGRLRERVVELEEQAKVRYDVLVDNANRTNEAADRINTEMAELRKRVECMKRTSRPGY